MTDWHEHMEAVEAAALETMGDLAAAYGDLRAALAADPKVQPSTVARLDLQRRFASLRVNDALGYAEAALGWDMPSRDPLFVHSEATQKAYEQYHSSGAALAAAGKEVVAARNRLMRAAGAAERALEVLGLVYDRRVLAPSMYPGSRDPLDRMRALHAVVAAPLLHRAGPSRPRNRSLRRRLTSKLRTGQSPVRRALWLAAQAVLLSLRWMMTVLALPWWRAS